VKLHRVSMRNFLPYKGNVSVAFPTDDFKNVMIVFGDNMRGKTSLLNAVRWGFYGEALGRHSIPIPLHQLANRDAGLENDWMFEVRIEFEDQGHKYDLRRRAEKSPLVDAPSRPQDMRVESYLTKDGIPIAGLEVANEINQILPKQVSRFFLFDGELLGEYETLLIEGSEQGRQIKEAIEEVLGVPALVHGRDELLTILRAAQRAQTKEIAHVSGLENQARHSAQLTTAQESALTDLQSLQGQLEKVRSERTVLDDEIEAGQATLSSKAKLDSLIEQQREIALLRDSKRIDRVRLMGDAWQDLVEAKIVQRRRQLEAERATLTAALRDRGGAEKEVRDLQKLLETRICPTCTQEISEERRKAIGTSLGSLQGRLEHARDDSDALQRVSAQIEALSQIKGSKVRDRVEAIDRDLQGFEVRLTKIDNELERLRDELSAADAAELSRKRALRDEKVKEEGRLQNVVELRRKDIEKIRSDLAVAQRAIESLAQGRTRRSTQKTSVVERLETVFSRSIEDLRDRLRERVERLANEAFHAMTTQKGYGGLEINANYGLSIVDTNGRKVPLRSAGAEQVVALSLIDGLNRTGRTKGPIIMDTPFGRLDLEHRDKILQYLPKVTSQFAMFVHSGEIRPDTDLAGILPRIGASYRIREVSPFQSVIEEAAL
jgi:DNA sulfur modification protein DndD